MPLAEKNSAAWHHMLRSLISLHNEHHVYWTRKLPHAAFAYLTNMSADILPCYSKFPIIMPDVIRLQIATDFHTLFVFT
jgi:hypothetical protein